MRNEIKLIARKAGREIFKQESQAGNCPNYALFSSTPLLTPHAHLLHAVYAVSYIMSKFCGAGLPQ